MWAVTTWSHGNKQCEGFWWSVSLSYLAVGLEVGVVDGSRRRRAQCPFTPDRPVPGFWSCCTVQQGKAGIAKLVSGFLGLVAESLAEP